MVRLSRRRIAAIIGRGCLATAISLPWIAQTVTADDAEGSIAPMTSDLVTADPLCPSVRPACGPVPFVAPLEPRHETFVERFRSFHRRWSWKKSTSHCDKMFWDASPYCIPSYGYHPTTWRRGACEPGLDPYGPACGVFEGFIAEPGHIRVPPSPEPVENEYSPPLSPPTPNPSASDVEEAIPQQGEPPATPNSDSPQPLPPAVDAAGSATHNGDRMSAIVVRPSPNWQPTQTSASTTLPLTTSEAELPGTDRASSRSIRVGELASPEYAETEPDPIVGDAQATSPTQEQEQTLIDEESSPFELPAVSDKPVLRSVESGSRPETAPTADGPSSESTSPRDKLSQSTVTDALHDTRPSLSVPAAPDAVVAEAADAARNLDGSERAFEPHVPPLKEVSTAPLSDNPTERDATPAAIGSLEALNVSEATIGKGPEERRQRDWRPSSRPLKDWHPRTSRLSDPKPDGLAADVDTTIRPGDVPGTEGTTASDATQRSILRSLARKPTDRSTPGVDRGCVPLPGPAETKLVASPPEPTRPEGPSSVNEPSMVTKGAANAALRGANKSQARDELASNPSLKTHFVDSVPGVFPIRPQQVGVASSRQTAPGTHHEAGTQASVFPPSQTPSNESHSSSTPETDGIGRDRAAPLVAEPQLADRNRDDANVRHRFPETGPDAFPVRLASTESAGLNAAIAPAKTPGPKTRLASPAPAHSELQKPAVANGDRSSVESSTVPVVDRRFSETETSEFPVASTRPLPAPESTSSRAAHAHYSHQKGVDDAVSAMPAAHASPMESPEAATPAEPKSVAVLDDLDSRESETNAVPRKADAPSTASPDSRSAVPEGSAVSLGLDGNPALGSNPMRRTTARKFGTRYAPSDFSRRRN